MAETESKRCRTCEQLLPITEFNRSTNYTSGRLNRCRACTKVYADALAARESQEHRETRLAKHRARTFQWKRENKDWIREYTARTKEANTERHRRWRYANPDKWAAVVRVRDGRKRGGIGQLCGRKMREWTAAQKKVCHWCGKKCANDFQVDHIVPLKRGGPHEAHNLCISCPPCNQRKSAKDPIDFAREIGRLL